MIRCLEDGALVELFYASPTRDGRSDERSHLCACIACARRYRSLCDDLGVVDTALSSPPPRIATFAQPQRRGLSRWWPDGEWLAGRSLGLRWAATGLAAAAIAIGLAALVSPATKSTPAPPKHVAGIDAGFRKVSAAIFPSPRAGDAAVFSIGSEIGLLQAALDGTDTCGSAYPFDPEGCADDRLALAPRWR